MIRMGSQPSMCVTRPVLYRLVNVFSSGVARLQVLGVSHPGGDTAPSSNTASYHSPMSIPAAAEACWGAGRWLGGRLSGIGGGSGWVRRTADCGAFECTSEPRTLNLPLNSVNPAC